MDKVITVYFPECQGPALRLSERVGIDAKGVGIHHFPDGESLVTLPEDLPQTILIYRSLNQPNEKLVELLLLVQGARACGVKRAVLIAPYLCYMRQDKSFKPGQVVSQRVIGQFLAEHFDGLVTVDAHLHRTRDIGELFPGCLAKNITAAREIAIYLRENWGHLAPMLIGPDEESTQWVEIIAQETGFPYAVCKKRRLGDRDVDILLPRIDPSQRNFVLIDDMISTGKTIGVLATGLRQQGANWIGCAVTHALFGDEVQRQLMQSGIDEIISTDTVVHSTNKIFMDQEIARVISDCFMPKFMV